MVCTPPWLMVALISVPLRIHSWPASCMLVALAIVAICITSYYLAKVYNKNKLKISPLVYGVTIIVLIISIVQIVFGTEVRETIDSVSNHLQGGYRQDWISDVGDIFIEHRSMAIFVLIGRK